MPECESCGAFVSSSFVRVFGSNEHEIYQCIECATYMELADGEAAQARQ